MKGARSSVLTATARVDRLEGDRNVAGLIAELGNPLGRGRYRQVRGYAAIALGNIGDPRAAPPLIELATDPSDVVRMNVHEALGKVGAHEAIPVLIDALRDRSVIVRSAAAESFGRLRATQALEPLRTRFRSDDDSVKWYAARALATIGDNGLAEPVRSILAELPWWARARRRRWNSVLIDAVAAADPSESDKAAD